MMSGERKLITLLFTLLLSNFTFCLSIDANFDFSAQLLISVLVLSIVGVIFLLVGYKFIRVVVVILGFILLSALTYAILNIYEAQLATWIIVIITIISGIIGGFLFHFLYSFAIFMVGATLGLIGSVYLLRFLIITFEYQPNNYFTFKAVCLIIMCIGSCIVGTITLQFQKVLIIITTSIIGGYILILAVFILLGGSVTTYFDTVTSLSTVASENADLPYVLLALWIFSSIVGMVVQALTNRKKKQRISEKQYILVN